MKAIRPRGDSGVAVAIVLMVGMVLVIVSTIVVARGARQMVNTAGDTAWDNALFSAEAGLDEGLVLVDLDFDFTTGETIPAGTLGSSGEREWVVAAADARDGSDVRSAPEGEYVLVRPENVDVLFAVGYAPSRSAVQRRVRVVRADVTAEPYEFVIEHALLVGGDLSLGGNTTINDTNDNDGASVHANGGVSFGGSYDVEGCLGSSATAIGASATCPPSPVPPEPLPVIDPEMLYPHAHFVLCSNGVAYGGPSHSTSPDPDGVPCTGDETAVTMTGWSSKLKGGVREWTTAPSNVTEGVVYIDHGNFSGKLGDTGNTLEVSVILSSSGDGACTAPPDGNLILAGNSDFTVHPSLSALGWDIAVVAQGDVDYQGTATVGGAIFVHEQIDYRGTADSWGAVVAVDACHTTGSPVSTSSLSGGSTINFPGPIQSPFTADRMRVAIEGWFEL